MRGETQFLEPDPALILVGDGRWHFDWRLAPLDCLGGYKLAFAEDEGLQCISAPRLQRATSAKELVAKIQKVLIL